MKRLIPRKFERKRFVGDAAVRPLLDGAPISVQVLDLGQSGLALFAPRCLPIGQLVELAFRVRQGVVPDGLAKRVGRVVRSQTHPDGNIIGIAFAEPLAAEELKTLKTNWVRS